MGPDAFVDDVVSYTPGDFAGFGQDRLPEIVYGPPDAPGGGGASTDVLTLGQEGEIVVTFDVAIVDGEGPDLLVFENPFTGWYETGYVAVSEDGEAWHEWPCDPTDVAGLYPGCAGVALVYASADNGVDPTDPAAAGGDARAFGGVGARGSRRGRSGGCARGRRQRHRCWRRQHSRRGQLGPGREVGRAAHRAQGGRRPRQLTG